MMGSTDDLEKYGERLFPHIIDKRARDGYERPFAMFSKTPNPSEGFEIVNYKRLANAVNRVCWWLEAEFSGEQERENAFAYFGPNDLRYIIFFFAAWKTGRKILIASQRNAVKAQLSLLERVHCKSIISCSSQDQILKPLFGSVPYIRKSHSPTLESILDENPVPHYHYEVTFETAPNYDILTVHTSGTSGDPKPIIMSTKVIAKMDQGNDLPIDQGAPLVKTTIRHENVLCLLPCFHAGGLFYNLFAILYEMTLVFGHASTPMTSEYVAELLKPGTATFLLSPPSILEDLAKDPFGLQQLARLKHVAYAGGPLRPEIGSILTEVLSHFFSQIGATEMGWHHLIVGGNEFWDSLRWYDDIGYKFEEISKGIFEQVVINDRRTNKYQYVFDVFPELSEYRTKDLYSPHPTAAGWWKYRGRADDLIVLSNGEKINPIPMENTIRSHPLVTSALVVGEYRFSPSLLVEMKTGHAPETELERLEAVKQIWPSVEKANRIAPGFAKIPKSLILFTTPEKPFLRAGKGTVQRQLTVKSYSKELDQLFLSQQDNLLIEGLTLDGSSTQDNIRTFTRQIYRQAMELDDLSDSDDVFHRGMDSLKGLVVVQRLRAAVVTIGGPINLEDINARLIYSAFTVDRMTEAILDLVTKPKGTEQEQNNAMVSRDFKMKNLLQQYSQDLPTFVSVGKNAHSLRTILLTGSTGSLGSYLLAALESLPKSKVVKVYCLNRSQNPKERQKKSNLDRGLNIDWDDERIEFLQADLTRLDFGLGAEKYAEIVSKTTMIIHNAWQVNFNLALDSFKPQIQGVRNLLDFSAQSSHKAPLVFVSSVSTAHGWMELHPAEIVPEAVLDDFDAPGQLGYSESKFICEHLVQEFSKSSGIPSIIMRTGQIAGPIKGHGVWNRQEWLPSIIASSKYLGVLPETLGTMEAVDWIPVDVLACIMAELVQTSTQNNEALTTVYNLVNPVSTTWTTLAPNIKNIIGIERLVALNDWIRVLEQSSYEKDGGMVEKNPALKLLDFVRTVGRKEAPYNTKSMYEVKALVRDSQRASELTEVTAEWMVLWMRQWRF